MPGPGDTEATRTETAPTLTVWQEYRHQTTKYMMTYLIARVITCCPGEEQRAYHRGPASLEGQRRFLGDVGGGGR